MEMIGYLATKPSRYLMNSSVVNSSPVDQRNLYFLESLSQSSEEATSTAMAMSLPGL